MWISAPPSLECSQVEEVLNSCPFLGFDTDKGCELMYGSGKPCTASSVWVERIDNTSESELPSEEDRVGREFRGNGMGRLEARVHKKSCVSRNNCVNFCEEHAAGLLDGLLFLSWEEGEGSLGGGRPRTAPKQPSTTTGSPPSPWRGSSAP
ncbi:hypothetical protein EDB19DRAFT_1672656 [Suillus lakei]|nr:hypothetical protein EDB19DRAFT_1672656 [Suillus lakei]